MANFYGKRRGGNAAEQIIFELCRVQGIPAELNPTPDPDTAPDEITRNQWYQWRAEYDIKIGNVYCDVKADWMSFHTKNIIVEAESLNHTLSSHFIYVLPRASSLLLHVFTVQQLIDLYNAKIRVTRPDRGCYESWTYPHKTQSGDQEYNPVVLLPMNIIDTVGSNFYSFTKALKQAA